MKKVIFLLLFLLPLLTMAQVATDGDYRSAKIAGNWSDVDMWETRSAGTWAVTAIAPAATSNVYIQNGHSVTVDVASANCKDIQLNIAGVLAIGANTLNVNGKIRAYSTTLGAITGAADGTFYSDQLSSTAPVSTMISTSGVGVLKFVGATRNITEIAEWNSVGLANAVEFALNTGATGTLTTGIKFKSVVFSSGTVTTATFISIGSTGFLIIKNGAKLISSRSGINSSFVGFATNAKCGDVTIEDGGALELTGSTPTIDCSSFTNNGSVIYSLAGSQKLLTPTAANSDAVRPVAITSYDTLILSGSNSKTPTTVIYTTGALETVNCPITVASLLKISGTATIAPTAINSLTMLNGSTVERNVISGTSIPSTVGAVFYGLTATDLVNLTISSNITNSNELPSAPTPGKVGTLTITNGITYTITGGRAVTDIVNNGFISLVPVTTLTFTINGNISGPGTITGSASASVTFAGANNGNAGTLNFTAGSQVANNLTINRTGTNASVTLGTPLNINGPTSGSLLLTAGTLIGGSNLINVIGNISGAGTYTATGAGKIVMAGKASAATISSVSLDNLELNDADGFALVGSPTITGTLTLTTGVLTIPPTNTLTISSGNDIAGAPFSVSKYIKCDLLSPAVGTLRINNFSTPKLFPVGSLTKYLPVYLTPASAMDYAVSVFEGVTVDGTPAGAAVSATLKESIVDAVWVINRQAGSGDCQVDINWDNTLEGTLFTGFADAEIGIGRYNGADWGSAVGTGNNTANTASGLFSSFSPFIVSKTGSVLPLQLKNISATLKNAAVEINWIVLNEAGVVSYEIEKSSSRMNFVSIGSVNATNRSAYQFIDVAPLSNLVYYRLKITGSNAQVKYSDIIVVKSGMNTGISMYPNPVVNTLNITGLKNNSTIKIRNAAGQQVGFQKSTASSLSMNVEALKPGIYVIEILSDNERITSQSFIKN
jgi:hypothetical protein